MVQLRIKQFFSFHHCTYLAKFKLIFEHIKEDRSFSDLCLYQIVLGHLGIGLYDFIPLPTLMMASRL